MLLYLDKAINHFSWFSHEIVNFYYMTFVFLNHFQAKTF